MEIPADMPFLSFMRFYDSGRAVLLCALLAWCCAGVATGTAPANTAKPRLLVLTDIGGDPDDEQALVRLLVYSNEFDIEGLIASAHTYKEGTPYARPDLIEERVRAYGKVRDNLLLHKPGYPTMEYLLERIKTGHADALGKEFARDDVWRSMGRGKDTEASDWIISVVDKPDPRPLWVVIWGGPNELAQALWKVRQTRSAAELAAFEAKLRVHSVGDQDNTGFWIEREHPHIFWLRNGLENWQESPDNQMERGMYQLGNTSLMSADWMNSHIRLGHGPLGALYPPKTWSPPKNAIKEGDTPAWFHVLPTGLSDPMEPGWGSWGGRFIKGAARWEDAQDTLWGITNERVCIARWRPHFQNDFQARMDWCVKPYAEANHEPLPAVEGGLRRTVTAGRTVNLSAAGSKDPDGNRLGYEWYFYREPGTYKGDLSIRTTNSMKASFVAPMVSSPETIHMILTVTDNGTPPLSRYRRIIITVNPS